MTDELKLGFDKKQMSPDELKKENMDLLIERESIRLKIQEMIDKIDEVLEDE